MPNAVDINRMIQKAVGIVRGKKAGNLTEPNYTAAIAVEFPQIWNASNTSSQHNIRLGGCFVHQSPMATFYSSHPQSSCELGDLLIFVRKQLGNDFRFNTSLVQLKTTDENRLTIDKDNELKQLFLYENWPCFNLKKLGFQYNIFPKTCTKGGSYCLIKKNKKNVQFYMAEPNQTMSCDKNHTLGKHITNMIDWQAGRVVSDEKGKDSDEWSRLIWDLLRYCDNTIFNQKAGYKNGQGYCHKRATGVFQMLNTHGEQIYLDQENNLDNNTNGKGLGILFIDIRDKKIISEDYTLSNNLV